MSLAHALGAARRETPGCRAAGYVDLRTRMTLLFDADGRTPRERVDAFGRAVAALLRLPGTGGEPVAQAFAAGQGEVLAAFRPAGRPGYGAFFVLDPSEGLSPGGGSAAVLAALGDRADRL